MTVDSAMLSSNRHGSLKWSIQSFLLDCQAKDLTDDTLDFYRRKLGPVKAFLVQAGLRRVSEIDLPLLQSYMAGLRSAGQSTGNIHATGRAIKAWLHWLVEEDVLDGSIFRRFRLPKLPQIVREAFTREEVAALIAAADRGSLAARDTALLLLMADTGIRAGEVGRIRDADVDHDRVLIHGKGRKERLVYLCPKTRKALAKYRKARGASEWFFVTIRDEPMDRQTVYKIFQRVGQLASITPCHPHMMRRSTAVEWIRAGGDSFTLQDLLGHSSQTMTRLYAQLASEDVEKAHRRLSLVERLGKKQGME